MPALIFDCDGVLADTEQFGHLPAFNQTFTDFDVPLQWSVEEYAEKVKIGGGKERMRRLMDVIASGRVTWIPENQVVPGSCGNGLSTCPP